MALWAPKWSQANKLDGPREHLILFTNGGKPLPLFKTRSACRDWINKHYGYIRDRKDLRQEPHGWRVPQAVRVEVREARS